ncbi:trichothecene 3-O-acetyltransferase [Alternaria panax]|uniref:Trichothecene 3-O-acetyltransferase n=1 Tax=Alternaria panax TaxID=48097 RepID=A0AAD4FHS3_9PLEO|nr:trichothecene 3-O-acetyltransferase [Alternaria panax]
MTPVLDMDIDLMGAQPALFKLYTQLAFIFPLPESDAEGQKTSQQHRVTSTVTTGLAELAAHFPWVAGQVVNTNPDSTQAAPPPHYKIRPHEPAPQLVPAPVMLTQISYIRGGLVLCVNMQHNVCDMMGQAAVMGWLSQACSGEYFTENELGIGNMTRVDVVPLLEEQGWLPGPELQNQLFPPPPEPATVGEEADTTTVERKVPEAPSKCAWTYFDFSAESLEALKGLATATLPQDFNGFISTDDALSAFIFSSVLRARQSRLRLDASVTFARAVDARRYLDIHPDYPGILQNMAYTSYKLDSLLSTPLGRIAAEMRQAVDPLTSDVAYRTRSLVTFLSQSPNNAAKTSFTATLDMSVDIALSSWTKVPAYEWDFGFGLGPPVAVRRPGFVPMESLMYLMPKSPEGSIAVAMCLREEDMQRLMQDKEWNKAARYVG